MIVGVGRRKQLVGALAFVFITAAPVLPGLYIHEVQQNPSHKLEYRHVTPTGVTPLGTYIHEVQQKPSHKLELRHVTPVEAPPVVAPPAYRNVGNDGIGDIERDDREVIELVQMVLQSGILG